MHKYAEAKSLLIRYLWIPESDRLIY